MKIAIATAIGPGRDPSAHTACANTWIACELLQHPTGGWRASHSNAESEADSATKSRKEWVDAEVMGMCPDMFRGLVLEWVKLLQKHGDPQLQSLLINMAHSCSHLANSAERFHRLVETAAAPPEHPAVEALGRRLPPSRHRPRSAVIVRLFTQRGVQLPHMASPKSLASEPLRS
jgi:hypothetical protein